MPAVGNNISPRFQMESQTMNVSPKNFTGMSIIEKQNMISDNQSISFSQLGHLNMKLVINMID